MTRKEMLNQIEQAGIMAARAGLPCEAPVIGTMKIAAWERGWMKEYNSEFEEKQKLRENHPLLKKLLGK